MDVDARDKQRMVNAAGLRECVLKCNLAMRLACALQSCQLEYMVPHSTPTVHRLQQQEHSAD
jgi:hypothetical protein